MDTATRPRTFDGPGTEDDLDAIEALAEAMWRVEGVVGYGAEWDAEGWQYLDESFRQEYRGRAETWWAARLGSILAEVEAVR